MPLCILFLPPSNTYVFFIAFYCLLEIELQYIAGESSGFWWVELHAPSRKLQNVNDKMKLKDVYFAAKIRIHA